MISCQTGNVVFPGRPVVIIALLKAAVPVSIYTTKSSE
jgi:hypothetical protein